jgi:very-short-patch-repair endonuclease
LKIVGEHSACLFDILVRDRKSMSFLAKPDSLGAQAPMLRSAGSGSEMERDRQDFVDGFDKDELRSDNLAELEWIERLSSNSDALTDLNLQTNLEQEALQKKLLKLFYDARSFEEEQGVNVLYMACGFLKWREQGTKKDRFAPLLLIPVELTRTKAGSKFQLRYREDDIVTNLSIQARLHEDFSVRFPDVPESCADDDEFQPSDYFQSIESVLGDRDGWKILPNEVVLWFFSFTKFLMFKDLQVDAWPEHSKIDSHPLISAILGEGFRGEPSFEACSDEDVALDDRLNPADVVHVTDADSSQAVVIDEVTKGRSLVVQGPPGTGKSQTITNVIAAAVHAGKRVLFVSEKMAALEVVKRRLDQVGLGDMILELHSNKARKQEVLANLKQTLSLGQPIASKVAPSQELRDVSIRLREHDHVLHGSIGNSGTSPYQAMGQLLKLKQGGMATASYSCPQMKAWDKSLFEDLHRTCGELQELMARSGPTKQNVWFGARCQPMTPADLDRLQVTLKNVMQQASDLLLAGRNLTSLLEIPEVGTVLGISESAQLAKHIMRCPHQADRHCLSSAGWDQHIGKIESLLSQVEKFKLLKLNLLEQVVDLALIEDWDMTRRTLASRGRSWIRWLSSEYRGAVAKLRSVMQANVELPKQLDQRIALIDQLRQYKAEKLSIESSNPIGIELLGKLWKESETDVQAAAQVVQWVKECQKSKFLKQYAPTKVANQISPADLQRAIEPIGRVLKQVDGDLNALVSVLKLDVSAVFQVDNARLVRLDDWISKMQHWLFSPEQLSHYLASCARLKKLESAGLSPLVTELENGYIAANQIVDRFNLVRYESLLSEAWQINPGLAEFHGTVYESLRNQFVNLDLQRIAASRLEVARKHFAGLPNQSADAGQVGVVKREINKKRRNIPLRKLMLEAGQAIQKIKPVFMMSPLSIANYLPPGSVDFDLLVIDEASQVQPVDALGAIARCRQIVVVGDQKQLPPTNFFGRAIGSADADSDEDNDEFSQAGDMESILGLCEAQGIPNRMLRWHYRSKHQSLIAVSNRQFYENRLFIVPSPISSGGSLGLKLRYVADGCYDRGGTRTNRTEAIVVAKAVMDHFRKSPELSLGVATFSSAQRDAILDELELLRQADSSLEDSFRSGGVSPFFVKSIENVQGDERDVIFISVGYGRDASGVFYQSFGPLNTKGGERRLNVLISRAACQCVVFSSIRAIDIDLNRTQAEGVVALKLYLNYAEHGVLETNQSTGDSESVFEDQVALALRRRGFQVDHQIGVAGFFIDLAVRDPNSPGRYLLGIECDGAQYHSARWVRDRDRLRQQILESRGWKIHRIWSTDWFQRPQEELESVIAAIESAREYWQTTDNNVKVAQFSNPKSIDSTMDEFQWTRDSVPEFAEAEVEIVPGYVEASFSVSQLDGTIQQLTDVQVAGIVREIVRIESPIHTEELCRRVLTILGNGRLVASARRKVEEAIRILRSKRIVEQLDEFVFQSGQSSFAIRSRENTASVNLRKIAFIAPQEIQEAILKVVSENIGTAAVDTAGAVSKMLGIPNSYAHQEAIVAQIDLLRSQDRLADRSGKLFINSTT